MAAQPGSTARLPIVLVAIAVVVMAALAAGVGSTFRAATTAVAAGTARLAVVDAAGSLAITDDRGESITALDVRGATFQFPAWSPDGTMIAAIGIGPDGAAVYVFDVGAADGPDGEGRGGVGDPAVLFASDEQPPFYLSWSPDSERVTFLTTERDGIALRVAPADAGTEASIVREGQPFYWDWVEPDRLLLHVGSDGPAAFIGEVGLDGRSFEPEVIAAGTFRAPAVGPGAKLRAYVGPSDGDEQAVVVEARDGSGRRSVPVHGNVAIGFDPTASALAFIAAPGPVGAPTAIPVGPLRILDADSEEPRTVLDGPVVGFFWSPDGMTIAALTLVTDETPDAEEVVARIGPTTVAPAARGVPLRLSFVDTANGSIRSERDLIVSEDFAFQLLPYFDQYALSHRFWAPDSSSIAVPIATSAGSGRLMLVPSDGSDPSELGGAVIGFWSP